MTELSNAVTVLIARMESHPEDFEMWGPHRAKFAGTAEALYGLVGLDEDKKNAYWFLSDADKEALIAAWRKFHLAKFGKDVMDTIFDDGSAEREREAEAQKLKMQMYQQQIYQQQAQMPQPVSALNAAQGSGNYYNGGGFLGSVGSALQGLIR